MDPRLGVNVNETRNIQKVNQELESKSSRSCLLLWIVTFHSMSTQGEGKGDITQVLPKGNKT